MCQSPHKLPNGELVACRECWQCRENRINDWAGRCIAESKTALAAYAVTLTYGRNEVGEILHERAAVLTYSDVQKYFKVMRRHGLNFKYFAVGEYGPKKGRAHWHLILFFKREAPDHPMGKRFHDPNWPHGFSFWERCSTEQVSAVKYVCKYVQKDLADALQQGHLAMSKKPPIGSEYFAGLAQRHVDVGVSPADLFYSFAGVNDAKGEKIQFMLPKQSRSAELYIQEFVTRWRKQRPGQHWPHSDIVDWFQDKWCDYVFASNREQDVFLRNPPPPAERLMVGATWREFDFRRSAWVCTYEGETWIWRNDIYGGKSWQRDVDIRNAKAEAVRKEAFERDMADIRAAQDLSRASKKSLRAKRRKGPGQKPLA